MRRLSRLVVVIGLAGAVGAGLVACGDESGSGGGTIIRGTTDLPVTYDPAGSYDLPSYDVIYNVYQNLLQFPPGESKPQPEAAESCEFTDDLIYECTLKDGLKFSDGSDLTAEDVAFSFERNVEIADPNGASSLLANMKSVEATDDKTVVFKLKAPGRDLALGGGRGIVRDRALRCVPEGQAARQRRGDRLGPLQVADYQPGQQTVLQANPEYTGDDPPKVDQAIIQYFDKASPLKLALEQGRRRHRLPQPQPDRPRRPPWARRGRGRRGQGRGDPLPGLQLRPATRGDRRAEARDPPGRRADDRPAVDRRQRLQRHRRAALLDDPGERSSTHTPAFADAYGESPDVERRETDARGRRRRHARAARDLVDADATTGPPRATSTRRSSASSTTADCST